MDVHRDPEERPMWVKADGSTRSTSPYKVELVHGDEDQTAYGRIGIDEETPLIASEAKCQATE
eukprot:12412621-Prorocentrum_lima.AAC.1